MNFFDYMFARLYNSRINNAQESAAGSSMIIGFFIWLNLLAAFIYILLFFDVRIRSILFPWPIILLYLLTSSGVWLLYRFRQKEVLEKYSRAGKSAARTSLIWIYIIVSIGISVRAFVSSYKHDYEMFNKERIIAPAVITDINIRRSTGRSTHGYFFRYKFTVNGKRYCGLVDHDDVKDKVIPGDSLAIFYAKSDPEISAVALNANGNLVLKKKYN